MQLIKLCWNVLQFFRPVSSTVFACSSPQGKDLQVNGAKACRGRTVLSDFCFREHTIEATKLLSTKVCDEARFVVRLIKYNVLWR